ncbi:long-chain fatty acid--CoA ligase [Lipingzhangella sp. LS1_29]|uniref:Acyl-CoA synthetase n=1 Tax=Lipingzhangella rawalii TaxID=2055835 RepID=A0ABU2H241_9ACTN|nr:long-chain fatty acid--CoA ligase [Lipingzhangella rawalii]MDS1268699.1 long-chain fatty acid--CoA ligase [Lipingzhangella rawalii]
MREYTNQAKVEVTSDQRLTDKVFERAAAEPNGVMFRRQEGASWRDVTAREFRDDVSALAKGLVASGIDQGDRVGLMARTRYEWTLLDYAIWTAGAVTVPIYETSSAEQVEWVLSDSGAKAVFVEHAEHQGRVEEVRGNLEGLTHVWQIDGGALDELRSAGTDISDEALEDRRTSVTAEQLATIIYTSGTTGRPKGCELTHHNLLATIRNVNEDQLKDIFGMENRATLLFLPLAHSFARIIQIGCVESDTIMGHFPDVGPELIDALGSYQPTFLLAVPRVFEKVYNKAEQKAMSEGKGKIFQRAADTAIEWSKAQDTPGGPGLGLRIKHAIFAKLVYRKILDRIGGKAQYAVSGGSALGSRLGHFFRGAGLTILEGYGITETSAPATVNPPDKVKVGTVGRPLPGVSIKLDEDGEVLIKGINVMQRYRNREDATKDAFTEDGWYRSGDLGSIDEDGYLSITGRKKEILVTSGGKNVAPAVLEDRVSGHSLVSQCMVVGDGRNFISALVTIDPEAIEFWKQQNNKTGEIAELVDDPDLVAEIQTAIDNANNAVSKAESIRKFTILPEEWTIAGGYVSDSMKIKRHVVTKQFANEIEKMYAEG